jgi:hypothetical protein
MSLKKTVDEGDVARLSMPPMEPKDLGGTFSLKGFDFDNGEMGAFLKTDKGKALSTFVGNQLKEAGIEPSQENIISAMRIEQDRQQAMRKELGGRDPKVLHDTQWSHVEREASRITAEANKPAAAATTPTAAPAAERGNILDVIHRRTRAPGDV